MEALWELLAAGRAITFEGYQRELAWELVAYVAQEKGAEAVVDYRDGHWRVRLYD
ncbi:MAG: hypothetical protein K6T57_15640 [Thermaceae bacterium]|nr:hypothetical protein [Thermaceae bacterium]